ncbi:MAG: class I SAM-dependent methyltransferase [Paludibacteraceae bacterium]|nr:class I SAM-dependent methyltransferase [Paludibacteraceae bacterium]
MQHLYRFLSYIRHYLTAWNTGGEGIHSPYLFYLVRMLLYDDNAYYIWNDIEKQRRQLLSNNNLIKVNDLGTGRNKPDMRRISDIAHNSLEQPRMAQLLFRYVLFLSQNNKQPLNILELGTSLGITTAYMAAADSKNKITTIEGSQTIAHIAQNNWQQLHLNNINLFVGNIDDILPELINEHANWDIVFVDANHTYEATIRYWQWLRPYKQQKSIFIFDDIHASHGMYKAWKEIIAHPDVTSSFDLFHMGLVFFNKHYIKKHYRLRY